MTFKVREPFNGFSHLFGAVASVLGMYILVRRALIYGTGRHVVSFAIFGMSLILLYSSSALYHLLFVSDKATKILRYVDHSMIYVLIAGTYTPLCLISLWREPGLIVFACIWGLTIAGMITTGIWLNAPRWLSTLIYTIMGWLIIVTTSSLIPAITLSGFEWLLGGGILYSIGAIIYGLKWPNLPSGFLDFHGIFHLFILAGSFCHYWLIFKYVF